MFDTVPLIPGDFFDSLCSEAWEQCIKKRKSLQRSEKLRRKNLDFGVHGLLMLYLNRRIDLEYAQVKDAVGILVDGALEC
jgi:hypothetical protein